MASSLDQAAVEQYRRGGYVAPLDVLSPDEAAALRATLEAHEAATGGPLAGSQRHNAHFLFTWADRLVRHPRILDAVEGVIGPDILVRGTSFFIKEPHDSRFVSWHQDATYWGLDPLEVVTAWVAISESTAENGAMRVVPGTHREEQIPHVETFSPDNMLSRGQEIAVSVDPADAVTLALDPGQMSLHHVLLVHGSEPNPSPRRRIGFAIRYMPTHVRQAGPKKDPVALVRGTDAHGHFPHAPRPTYDLAPDAVAYHARAMQDLAAQADALAAGIKAGQPAEAAAARPGSHEDMRGAAATA